MCHAPLQPLITTERRGNKHITPMSQAHHTSSGFSPPTKDHHNSPNLPLDKRSQRPPQKHRHTFCHRLVLFFLSIFSLLSCLSSSSSPTLSFTFFPFGLILPQPAASSCILYSRILPSPIGMAPLYCIFSLSHITICCSVGPSGSNSFIGLYGDPHLPVFCFWLEPCHLQESKLCATSCHIPWCPLARAWLQQFWYFSASQLFTVLPFFHQTVKAGCILQGCVHFLSLFLLASA